MRLAGTHASPGTPRNEASLTESREIGVLMANRGVACGQTPETAIKRQSCCDPDVLHRSTLLSVELEAVLDLMRLGLVKPLEALLGP